MGIKGTHSQSSERLKRLRARSSPGSSLQIGFQVIIAWKAFARGIPAVSAYILPALIPPTSPDRSLGAPSAGFVECSAISHVCIGFRAPIDDMCTRAWKCTCGTFTSAREPRASVLLLRFHRSLNLPRHRRWIALLLQYRAVELENSTLIHRTDWLARRRKKVAHKFFCTILFNEICR